MNVEEQKNKLQPLWGLTLMDMINPRVIHVWDAVVAWRDNIYEAVYENTRRNHLKGMLKLIESKIIDVCLPLDKIDECWLEEVKQKIQEEPEWSTWTKKITKSCLNSFLHFIHTDFDNQLTPYRRHPQLNEIRHVLSNVKEAALLKDISPEVLCNALSKINERDAYIVWLMMHTGEPLEAILAIRKLKEDYEPPYMRFNGIGKHIPEHITEAINEFSKNSKIYLFETARGNPVRRTQVMRNIKQAGYAIGLKFDLTPKILHSSVCAHMCRDKRSVIEKGLGISII